MSIRDEVNQRLGFIQTYDEQINSLKALRREHTAYFERLADEYYKQTLSDHHPTWSPLCCTSGYFVYGGSDENGLWFGTHCQWDGPNAGNGITIPWNKLNSLA